MLSSVEFSKLRPQVTNTTLFGKSKSLNFGEKTTKKSSSLIVNLFFPPLKNQERATLLRFPNFKLKQKVLRARGSTFQKKWTQKKL